MNLFYDASAPSRPAPSHFRRFNIILSHTTLGRNPLDRWSARRRDLYLTTHNTHNRQTSIPPAGFEPAIPASERPHTHALDRAATEIVGTYTLIKCWPVCRIKGLFTHWKYETPVSENAYQNEILDDKLNGTLQCWLHAWIWLRKQRN